jgi:hypothetical protein
MAVKEKRHKSTVYSVLNDFDMIPSGERGIRTPGPVTVNGFQDRRIRPLCHLSGANVRVGVYSKNKKGYFFENNFIRNSILMSHALCK